MDDALPMRVVHGVADLARVIEGATEIERALAIDDVLERFSRDVLHDDEEDVVLLLGGEHRHDVGMIEAREQARLANELAEVEILPVRNLQGDFLVDPRVFGEINRAEAAAAKRHHDAVLADGLPAEEHWPPV